MGAGGICKERRFTFLGGSHGEARNFLYRRGHISDRGKTQTDRLQKSIQESILGTEHASNTSTEFARGITDVWYGGYRYGRDGVPSRQSDIRRQD